MKHQSYEKVSVPILKETSFVCSVLRLFNLCQFCVDHNKLWKILREIGILDHLTCLLRHLCAGQKQQLESYME